MVAQMKSLSILPMAVPPSIKTKPSWEEEEEVPISFFNTSEEYAELIKLLKLNKHNHNKPKCNNTKEPIFFSILTRTLKNKIFKIC